MPSTVIRRFDYDPAARALLVEFVSGRRYRYLAVPEAEAQAMRGAYAKGRYFHARIRDRYACEAVEAADEGS
jgi:lysyl-tRNA synthetase class 2